MPQHNYSSFAERKLTCELCTDRPLAQPYSKARETFCPLNNTQAAGVVTEATEHIVAALKILPAAQTHTFNYVRM